MRGITPVIAIILLLLMAVAAAGGFYFMYQQFSSSGTESGSSQIEQLGDQSLTQLSIESVAAGKVYVRNVGASAIDATKLTVYVDNVPYSVNVSASSIAENGRATLKFTQVPACGSSRCEVKVSGTATASRSVEPAKLSCSSDGDCSYGESCASGICVTGEVAEEEEQDCVWYSGEGCGDCVCGEGEDGENCFVDCAPRSLNLINLDSATMDGDAYVHTWNGVTYVKGENLTNSSWNEGSYINVFDYQGNSLAVGLSGSEENTEVLWSYYNSTRWSVPGNITSNDNYDFTLLGGWDFNSTGDAIAIWVSSWDGVPDEAHNIMWSSFDGVSWTTPANLTDNADIVNIIESPSHDFVFLPDDKGLAVWCSNAQTSDWVNYSVWDDGWGSVENTITSIDNTFQHNTRYVSTGFNGTHTMAVWVLEYSYLDSDYDEVLQWSVWDNSSWSTPQNLSDNVGDHGIFSVGADTNGDWLLGFRNDSSSPPWIEWYSNSGDWTYEGNLTETPVADTLFVMMENENDALFSVFSNMVGAEFIYRYSYWDGTDWSTPVEFT